MKTDDVAALESGVLRLPEVDAAPAPVPAPMEVVRRWAVELGLRPGNSLGPRATALVKVVAAWAAERGWTAPDFREVGRGLRLAGFVRRRKPGRTGGYRLALLHPADAALLWRLVRAAWAPAWAPGDPRGPTHQRQSQRRSALGKLRRAAPRLKPTREQPPFHAELKQRTRPVVDSLGRVWPSVAVAATAMGGSRQALANAVALYRKLTYIEAEGPVSADALRSALNKGAAWRGVWWRYLTHAEVAAVPPGTLSGGKLPGFGWGLTCPRCGACPPAGP